VSTPRTLARRYARALLDVAGTHGADAVLALRDELRAFAPVLAGHPELSVDGMVGLFSVAKMAPEIREKIAEG